MISEPTWADVMAKCGDFSHESQACQNAIDQAGNEAGNNFNVYGERSCERAASFVQGRAVALQHL